MADDGKRTEVACTKQRRESRKGLPPVPRDPDEAMLFGGGAR